MVDAVSGSIEYLLKQQSTLIKNSFTRLAAPKTTRRINPSILIVHGKLFHDSVRGASNVRETHTHPTTGIKLLVTMGKTTPPSDDPTATIPIASPLRFLNQCAMTAAVGPKIPPHAACSFINQRYAESKTIRTPTAIP